MSKPLPTKQEAADIFLKKILNHGYQGSVQGQTSVLEKGPPGKKPPQHTIELYQWFQQLDQQDRNNVLAIIRETAKLAVFGCLVVLDNMTVGYPLEGELSDFAVYLQTYENADARKANISKRFIRINPASTLDEDLHDMMIYALKEIGQ